jgi:NCS2 family nucleobase:cation symporter-2
MRKPDHIVYGTDDSPPSRVAFILALQQMSFLGTYLVVSPLFARTLGLDHGQSLQLISATLLASGLGVVLQANRVGGIGSGYLCPVQATSSTFSALVLSKTAGGLGAMFGMVGVLGLSQMVFAHLFQRLRTIFTVQVAGLAVMLIGLGLGFNGVRLMLGAGPNGHAYGPQEALLFLLTLVPMIVCNVWTMGYPRLFSAFLGLSFGFGGACLLGAIPEEDWEILRDAPWFYLPQPMHIGWELSPGVVLPGIVTGLFLALHGFGAVVAAQRFNDADWKRPDLASVRRGVLAEGLTNLLNSLLNGLPLTSSGGAVGLAAATGCTSRRVAYWLGGLMALLAFMPKAIVFWDILPEPVMGAALIFLAAFTTLAGLQVIASRLLDNRKVLTVGIALILGLSYEPLRVEFQAATPDELKVLMFSGVGLGVLAAVLLSAVFRVRDHTRDRRSFDAHGSSLDDVVAFLEQQGRRWGARAEVVRRAEYATWQAFEILAEHGVVDPAEGRSGTIEVETVFNEYSFAVILYYPGAALSLSLHPPTHEEMLENEDAVLLMAGYLLHRLADQVRTRAQAGRAELRLIFND